MFLSRNIFNTPIKLEHFCFSLKFQIMDVIPLVSNESINLIKEIIYLLINFIGFVQVWTLSENRTDI